MGILADRLDAMRIEASSPDGQLTGTFHLQEGVSIGFRDGSYRHYRERGLEHQLSALVKRWWTDYQTSRDAAVAEASNHPVSDDEPWDARSRRFRAERSETVFEGMSGGGHVFIRSIGLRECRVAIRDGALSALDEHEFAAEVTSGYGAMMRDYHVKLIQLRDKHFPH